MDATRGLGDLCDDLHALLEVQGLPGRDDVVAPLSPYGFGGIRGEEGSHCTDDDTGTGGGGAAPPYVEPLRR